MGNTLPQRELTSEQKCRMRWHRVTQYPIFFVGVCGGVCWTQVRFAIQFEISAQPVEAFVVKLTLHGLQQYYVIGIVEESQIE